MRIVADILVTSLPLPKFVGIKILNLFNFDAINFAMSKTLPPPKPMIVEKLEFLTKEQGEDNKNGQTFLLK